MQPETRKLLTDMQRAANDVAGFAVDRGLQDFLGDKQFRMAVEPGFEIIGEALSQLRENIPGAVRCQDW